MLYVPHTYTLEHSRRPIISVKILGCDWVWLSCIHGHVEHLSNFKDSWYLIWHIFRCQVTVSSFWCWNFVCLFVCPFIYLSIYLSNRSHLLIIINKCYCLYVSIWWLFFPSLSLLPLLLSRSSFHVLLHLAYPPPFPSFSRPSIHRLLSLGVVYFLSALTCVASWRCNMEFIWQLRGWHSPSF